MKPETPKKTPFLVSRGRCPEGTVVSIGSARFGGGFVSVIAGPCSIESREQYLSSAHAARESGAAALRGGMFKHRTSPYDFQGLGETALSWMAEAKTQTDLPLITEVLEPAHIAITETVVDAYQIGSRNAHNVSLLRALGRCGKPVILKRGMMMTIEEWLFAAEYLLSEGNTQVILCERGIRTFEPMTRNTLDISAIPLLKQLTHLPVIADPSHAAGRRDIIPALSKAAIAAGADGLMIEIHPDPEKALSDAEQSLSYEQFAELMGHLQSR